MTVKKLEFEPIAVIKKLKDEIPPETPGFAEQTFNNDNKEDYSVFSKEQLDQIRNEAFSEGYNKAKSEVNQLEQKNQEILKQALSNLSSKFDELIPKLEEISRERVNVMVSIALKAAEKVVKNLMTKNTESMLKECIEKSLAMLIKESSITISVNPKVLSAITTIIDEFKNKSNFKGQIILKGNEQLHEINCLIEWQDGMIENNTSLIWDVIEKIIPSNVDIDSNGQTNQQESNNLVENNKL